jgi:hypothetical protein
MHSIFLHVVFLTALMCLFVHNASAFCIKLRYPCTMKIAYSAISRKDKIVQCVRQPFKGRRLNDAMPALSRVRTLQMVNSEQESKDESNLLAQPRSQMVEAFRSIVNDAGIDRNKRSLNVKEISMALSRLGYGQQEIECVFKQIDLNGTI